MVFELGLLRQDDGGDVDDRGALFVEQFFHFEQQFHAGYARIFFVRVGKEHADVAGVYGGEQGVHYRVHEHVRVRMPQKPFDVRDSHAAENELSALDEPMRVKAAAHAHAARGKVGAYSAQSPFIAEPSRSRPTTREELADCFLKVDGLPIDVRFDEIDTDGQSFAVRSQLNAFRRAVWADIYGRLSAAHPPLEERGIPPQPAFAAEPAQGRLAVIDRDFSAPCYRERMLDYAIFDHVDCKNEGYIRDFLHYAKYYARHKGVLT